MRSMRSVQSASTITVRHSEGSRKTKNTMRRMTLMTDKYLDALLTITEVMRAHNRPKGGITHIEACERIYETLKPVMEEQAEPCENCEEYADEKTASCMTRIEQLRYVLDTYGRDAQLNKAVEEVIELADILIKVANKGLTEERLDSLIDEMADTYIMLEQIKMSYSFPVRAIDDRMSFKLDRQIKRIKELRKWG